MTLITTILENRAVTLTIAVAALVFVAIVGLNVGVVVRATLERQAQERAMQRARQLAAKRARAKALRDARLAAAEAAEASPAVVEAQASPETQDAQTMTSDSGAGATAEGTKPEGAKPEAAAAAAGTSESSPEATTEANAPSNTMQVLLSDVFRDEEAEARRQALLNNVGNIGAQELLEQCENIREQLHARAEAIILADREGVLN